MASSAGPTSPSVFASPSSIRRDGPPEKITSSVDLNRRLPSRVQGTLSDLSLASALLDRSPASKRSIETISNSPSSVLDSVVEDSSVLYKDGPSPMVLNKPADNQPPAQRLKFSSMDSTSSPDLSPIHPSASSPEHHLIRSETTVEEVTKGTLRSKTRPCFFKCFICNRRFASEQATKIHMNSHVMYRQHVCPHMGCSKAFTSAANLNSHIRTHTGERPFECSFPECGKRFSERGTLNKHFRIHTGEKPYSCSICGRKFAQNGHMQRHERSHVPDAIVKVVVCRPEPSPMLPSLSMVLNMDGSRKGEAHAQQ